MTSLKEVVQRNIERFMASVFTSIPAEVVGVDNYESQAVIDVQPKIADVSVEDLSSMKFGILKNVPVKVYSGGGAVVTVPIKVGDVVMLEFAMRNIQNWKEGDNEEISTPNDARQFHISDAVAYPCIYQKTNNPNPNPDDLELRFNGSIVRLKEDGNITISTKGNITVEESVDIEVNNSGNVLVNTEGNTTVNTTGNTELNTTGNSVTNVDGNFTANIGGSLSAVVDGTTTVESAGTVTINTDNTTITGELRVDGGVSCGADVTTDAGISLNQHVHTGNLSAPTSPPLP
jgi:hypothetical protein